MGERWSVRVLEGPRLERDGEPVRLPTTAARVLACLALRQGEVVGADELIDGVWGHAPPSTARKSLQNQIVRLRTTFGADAIETSSAGYRLAADAATSDVAEFAQRESAATKADAEPRDALEAASAAVAMWTGATDPGFGWPSEARRAYDRLLDRFATIEERHVDLLMIVGNHESAIGFARHLVDQQPFREQRWGLLMLALYRAGRRRDALSVFGTARRRFLDEIGIEPGPMLRRLEAQVVADDPRLLSISPVAHGWSWRLAADETEIFVGRKDELLHLASELERVRAGDGPRLVDVCGEPGIGKTALVNAFVSSIPAGPGRTIVLLGRCDPFSDQALHPVTNALMSVVPIDVVRATANADSDPAALAAVLPELVDRPAPTTADVTRDRIEDAVVRVLRELERYGQLVIVFEDLHWATPRVGQLIDRILTGDGGNPLVLITRRDTEPVERGILEVLERARTEGHGTELALGPLPEDALDAYLSEVFGTATERAQLLTWVRARTEGHPLFVRELLNHLVATNAIEVDGAQLRLRGDIGPLPDSLRTAIAERIATLSAATVATLQVAAAAGSTCDRDLLEALAGDVSFAIQEGQRARLVARSDLAAGPDSQTVMLAHDLVRRYLYDLMPEPRRVEMHERLGGCLVGVGGPTADIAHHYRAAAPLDARRALDWTVQAGREADANFDHDAAARQFAAARAFVERGSVEDIELAIAEGAARRRAGDPDHVECLLGAAEEARAIGDGSLLARAVIEVGDLGGATQAGSTDERVVPLLEDALLMVRDPVLEARLRAAVSVFFSLSEQWRRVRSLWEAAASAAEGIDDERLLLAVYQSADHGTGAPSQLDRRRQVSTRLAVLAARHHDANGSYIADYLAFTAALHDGTAAEIDEHLDRLERFDREVAHGEKVWTVTFSRAGRVQLAGLLEEAEALNDRALTLGTGMARSWTFAVYSGILIAIRKEQDRLGELQNDVSALVASQPGMHAWRAVAAYIAADVGDHDAAAELLADVVSGEDIRLPDDMTWMAAAAMLAEVAIALDDRSRADTIARALAPYSGRSACSGPAVFGAVDTSLGDLALLAGDRPKAAAHYRRASDVAARLGAPIMLGEANAALAALGLRGADDAEVLARVATEAEHNGWHRLAKRARSVPSTA